MKILLLVILYSRSGCSGCEKTWSKIVPSHQAAAVTVWEYESDTSQWDRYTYKLYEIDLEKNAVRRVDVPKLTFTKELKP